MILLLLFLPTSTMGGLLLENGTKLEDFADFEQPWRAPSDTVAIQEPKQRFTTNLWNSPFPQIQDELRYSPSQQQQQHQNYEFESQTRTVAHQTPQNYGNNNFGNRGPYTNQAPLGYSYAGYIHRQARRYPIMMYTLVQCVPCQRAKHLLAVNYSDIAAHFLELVGDEDWQRQLQVDLQRITGQVTFPYIFICGQHIGGSSDLFNLHHNGQLRSMLNNCSRR